MSSHSNSAQTMQVEVYEFPEDCIANELINHFYNNFHTTHCFTEEQLARNNVYNTFILEYSVAEAEHILAHPVQFLDDDDYNTRIRMRRYIAPTKCLLVSANKTLNARMIKNSFKKLAPIESCTQLDDRHIIVTLISAEDATRLASQQIISLNPSLDVDVQPYHGSDVAVSNSSPASTSSILLPMPDTWQPPLDRYQEIRIIPATPEYKKIEDSFMSSIGAQGSTVIEISRVQNPTIYQRYYLIRRDAAKRLGKKDDQVETTPLWHGTSEDTVSKITAGRFDSTLSGSLYGFGTYFFKKASDAASSSYCTPNDRGQKYIIQTRVRTGDWCLGESDLKIAPYKDQCQPEQYCCVVDDVHDPTLFVTFHTESAYPEYIIKFK